MEFVGDLYRLGAMGLALSTTYASACLPQTGNRTVVAHEKCLTRLAIVLALRRSRDVAFVDTLIIMQQYRRNVESVWARHAVLAVIARHRRILHHQISRRIKEFLLVVGQRLQRTERREIVDQMVLVGHAAQNGQDTGMSDCARAPVV